MQRFVRFPGCIATHQARGVRSDTDTWNTFYLLHREGHRSRASVAPGLAGERRQPARAKETVCTCTSTPCVLSARRVCHQVQNSKREQARPGAACIPFMSTSAVLFLSSPPRVLLQFRLFVRTSFERRGVRDSRRPPAAPLRRTARRQDEQRSLDLTAARPTPCHRSDSTRHTRRHTYGTYSHPPRPPP